MNTHIRKGCVACVDEDPDTSIQTLSVATGRSRRAVHRVLQDEALHLFHVQRVQLLQPDDYQRRVLFS